MYTALQGQRGSFHIFASELSRWPFIARWAPVPLRLMVGFGFMQHGFAKLSRGPDAFAAILHALGVPAPHFMTWATILTELAGGLALILGAFVTLVSLPMAALLLVAIFSVHLQYGFSSIRLIGVTNGGAQFGPVGYECSLLYLACLVSLVLSGSGPWQSMVLLENRGPDPAFLCGRAGMASFAFGHFSLSRMPSTKGQSVTACYWKPRSNAVTETCRFVLMSRNPLPTIYLKTRKVGINPRLQDLF